MSEISVLGGVALAALLWMIDQLRVRRRARELEADVEAQVAERTRIARELHDSLLQSINSLLPLLQTVSNKLPARPVEAKEMLDDTIGQAAEAIRESRQAMQGLHRAIEEPNDLAESIGELGEEIAAGRAHTSAGRAAPPIAFRVIVEGVRRRKRPIVRDEIYRIAAEALRNAFQHSQGTEIEVELRYELRQFRLRIRDNGRGIDPRILAAGGREGPCGLRRMQERAELIGGKLSVWSAPGIATEMEVSIPAARAFADLPSMSEAGEGRCRRASIEHTGQR